MRIFLPKNSRWSCAKSVPVLISKISIELAVLIQLKRFEHTLIYRNIRLLSNEMWLWLWHIYSIIGHPLQDYYEYSCLIPASMLTLIELHYYGCKLRGNMDMVIVPS
ncbi:hypothetical protein PHYBLDRAFT_169191 [Phycomyces blakesleeanus NRRL 1555(-)]|uniref:Uncharacterized protein n=1 Tax=Phycomyces blakesleeanus (strain ATCC 8743b / DSM 1359 / FGSC 10004 / NBRC 33097 / NRRL 1555) TaxID=763407 RepID=A0A162U2E4_PHYB8|nr:hypothetical protein PHYBLDRAFT_169191 [Phycomyces blakesleeanus NRRL 1555(-)]OAD72932.1 hypothetical protein PHYBLDRAFT_169191 [Phycomyces blakesleeanus NRRL 1555(-)]|eukprot:XP_018290972.1 hypothetical protein PHYBLDRAFT_169191 [Phycomyces blakesleeanus NRRL 1555(-)]